jgi:hypothetical protein
MPQHSDAGAVSLRRDRSTEQAPLGAKYVLWRQADTAKISLRWFIFVTLLRQGEYDDGVEV